MAGFVGPQKTWTTLAKHSQQTGRQPEVDHNLIPFGDGVVDREHQVGEATAALLDVIFDVLCAKSKRTEDRVVVTAIVCDEFRDGVEVFPAPTLVHQPLYDLLVVCGLPALCGHG
jgi:hypothetical protein